VVVTGDRLHGIVERSGKGLESGQLGTLVRSSEIFSRWLMFTVVISKRHSTATATERNWQQSV
jgi:hypothetical protein